ncbi:MAG: ABC transporter permease [Bacilli bacterium]|nr:ABC transporter permease [Bacilli bacterium]
MNESFKKLAKPYQIWLYILALFPVVVMFGLMFFSTEGISFDEASFKLGNFSYLLEVATLQALGNSFIYAFITTFLTIILGYMVAYRIFRSRLTNKFIILVILILPMWSNLLLRTQALGNIMEPNNILSNLFGRIGINLSINILGKPIGVLVGLTITYLPFMVLPIYTSLEKIDFALEEAALDLGATELQKFWKVVFPLSIKGIITGSILVFLPSLSGFAIPEILGKSNILFIGNLIEQAFRNMRYYEGSIYAIIILIIIFAALMIINKVDKEGEILL